MTLPALLFGALLATLYGSLFHLWKDGSLIRLLADIFLAWAGFWGGHLVAATQHWQWGMVGPLHFWPATIGSVAFLVAGHYLALPPADSSD